MTSIPDRSPANCSDAVSRRDPKLSLWIFFFKENLNNIPLLVSLCSTDYCFSFASIFVITPDVTEMFVCKVEQKPTRGEKTEVFLTWFCPRKKSYLMVYIQKQKAFVSSEIYFCSKCFIFKKFWFDLWGRQRDCIASVCLVFNGGTRPDPYWQCKWCFFRSFSFLLLIDLPCFMSGFWGTRIYSSLTHFEGGKVEWKNGST